MLTMIAMISGGLGAREFTCSHVGEDLIAKLKRRAARHERSAEAEHRNILRRALESEVEASFDTLAAELRQLTAQRPQTPAEDLQREHCKDEVLATTQGDEGEPAIVQRRRRADADRGRAFLRYT